MNGLELFEFVREPHSNGWDFVIEGMIKHNIFSAPELKTMDEYEMLSSSYGPGTFATLYDNVDLYKMIVSTDVTIEIGNQRYQTKGYMTIYNYFVAAAAYCNEVLKYMLTEELSNDANAEYMDYNDDIAMGLLKTCIEARNLEGFKLITSIVKCVPYSLEELREYVIEYDSFEIAQYIVTKMIDESGSSASKIFADWTEAPATESSSSESESERSETESESEQSETEQSEPESEAESNETEKDPEECTEVEGDDNSEVDDDFFETRSYASTVQKPETKKVVPKPKSKAAPVDYDEYFKDVVYNKNDTLSRIAYRVKSVVTLWFHESKGLAPNVHRTVDAIIRVSNAQF
jgi:hypothetical protein